MYIGVVLRIQEHQSRRNNTSMPKMLLVHLKKEEQGRGTLKNSSTSPENISEVVFFTFKWNFDALAAALAMYHRNNFLVLPHIFLRRNYDINK